MNIAVFAVDPGGATGLAWGIFDPHAEIGDALRGRMEAGSATVTGEIRPQIEAISKQWQAFFRKTVNVNRLPPESVWLVCEDFIYTGANYGGESAVYSTALIYGIEGYRMGQAAEWNSRRGRRKTVIPPMIMQQAGQAKGFAKNPRLKDWGIWVVGKEHERSAWQHIAFFLAKYKKQYHL